jgi:Xaa-Pro dipeptidase
MSRTVSEGRIARLRERMVETGTDVVIIGPTSHMRWLAGVDPHGDERPVLLCVSQTYAGFLMPGLNADSVRQHTNLPFHRWKDEDGPDTALKELLAACGQAKTVAIDEAMRADFALRALDILPGAQRSFTENTVSWLRAEKDENEFKLLKESAQLNDRVSQLAFRSLKEGMREADLGQIIRDAYIAEGAVAEFVIVGFGPNGAYPHHHTGEARLQRDMSVLVDVGARYKGYPSDMTRMGWFGKPSDEFLRVTKVVESAVQAALAASKPGVPAKEVDAAARGVIAAAGYGPKFLHRTGHGLGIDIHEAPYITATSEAPLRKGNVFSIEPGIYLEGQFGVRLEDIVYLRDDGPEILSDLTRTVTIVPA